MMHQKNQRSGEHALILDALRNAYAEFHDPKLALGVVIAAGSAV